MSQILYLPVLLLAAVEGDGVCAVTTLDGVTASGELIALSDAGVEMKLEGGSVKTWSTEELLEVRRPAAVATAAGGPGKPEDVVSNSDAAHLTPGEEAMIAVELTDGSRMQASRLSIVDRVATFQTLAQSDPSVLLTSRLQRIEFESGAEVAEAWESLQSSDAVGDALLVKQRRGESIDYLNGVVGDIDQDRVIFQWDGESIPVKRSKVAGVAFYHAGEPELEKLRCRIHLGDGSRLNCSTAKLDGDVVVAETLAGVEVKVRADSVQSFDFSAGKVAFLDEMRPVVESWTPQIELPAVADLIRDFGAPRRNSSFDGSPLALLWPPGDDGGQIVVRTFDRGLALRSRTVLEYRIDPGMRRFKAVAGIDPACLDQGDATLEVYAEDRLVWQGAVNGNQPPLEIDIPISQSRRLRLVCDYGNNLDFGDRVHLVNARVMK